MTLVMAHSTKLILMSRPISVRTHPFRFLLYIEWSLLVTAALIEAIPLPFARFPRLPWLTILSLGVFGVMGLRLPTGRQVYKVLYTGLEVFLILLAIVGGLRFYWVLLVFLIIRSCLIFELPGRLVATGLAFTSLLLMPLRRSLIFPVSPHMQKQFPSIVLTNLLMYGLILVFVLVWMNFMLAERQSREKLTLAISQLRQYAMRIEDQAMLQERNRIGRDIHDSLGHSLTALNLQLEAALKLWQSDPAKALLFLTQAKQLGSTALQEVRQSVAALRSDPLQARSLEEAIASLAAELHSTTAISPNCLIQLGRPIPAEVKTAIYRIVQEALTNISKYASATEVKINLSSTTTHLRLIVEDNGRGFKLDQNTTGFGLQSMRDRTLALGGQFNIDSAPGSGCRITADIPLPRLPQ